MKKPNDRTEPGRPQPKDDLPPTLRDPIEADPMNPTQTSPADIEPQPPERPDLDWAEHED